MAKRYAFTATITRLNRLKNSVNGNPRYEVGFDNASTFTTQSDQSFVYGIEGITGEVQVFLSKAGRIVDLQRVPEPSADESPDEILRKIRAYANALKLEAQDKLPYPGTVPSWVQRFEALDALASNGELPQDWKQNG